MNWSHWWHTHRLLFRLIESRLGGGRDKETIAPEEHQLQDIVQVVVEQETDDVHVLLAPAGLHP
jgi:hypothetical protein